MSNNSAITCAGGEVDRAQVMRRGPRPLAGADWSWQLPDAPAPCEARRDLMADLLTAHLDVDAVAAPARLSRTKIADGGRRPAPVASNS